VETPGADKENIKEPSQSLRSFRLNQIQQQTVIPQETRNLDT
jgi:hypothetical protein